MKKIHQTTLIENLNRVDFLKWLIGFIEGEGCFCILFHSNKNIPKKKPQVRAIFQLGLASLDKDILYRIQKEIGIGRIYHQKKKTINGTVCKISNFKIEKTKDLFLLVNILDNFTFYTKKKNDYELWKMCLRLIKTKKHLKKPGIDMILDIREKMNIRENKNEI